MLDIILVNWNSGNQLRECLNSIFLSKGIELENLFIYIIDNNSSDESLDNLPHDRLNIQVIKNKENRGFGAACNQGIKMGNSDLVLFLNLDVILFEETLLNSINFIKEKNEITVLGVKHVDKNNTIKVSCARFPSFGHGLNRIFGLSSLFPNLFLNEFHMSEWDHNDSRFVDHVMGAYYLVRRLELLKVNGFDERYFVFIEDVDLSHKIKDNGGKVFYNSDIKIIHHGSGTTNQVKAFRLFLSLQSRLLYTQKYWSKFHAIVYKWLLLTVGLVVRLLFSILKLDKKGVNESFKGYGLLYNKLLNINKINTDS